MLSQSNNKRSKSKTDLANKRSKRVEESYLRQREWSGSKEQEKEQTSSGNGHTTKLHLVLVFIESSRNPPKLHLPPKRRRISAFLNTLSFVINQSLHLVLIHLPQTTTFKAFLNTLPFKINQSLHLVLILKRHRLWIKPHLVQTIISVTKRKKKSKRLF